MQHSDVISDVIIVGAGVSGIGAAVHLKKSCPGKTFTILEGRQNIGGTWDLFRYPGIRSDSDMHTFGFDFKPWKNPKSIADGPSILEYLNETIDEYDLSRHIRFQHLVSSANWSTDKACWQVTVQKTENDGSIVTAELNCRFLLMCGGYYSYKEGYLPEFNGIDQFRGEKVHPQFWPEQLDYEGKKVIVIGSGATAMTIVPNMAKGGARVTMLQRSPTYVVSRPDTDAIANFLRKIFPEKIAYWLTRFKNINLQRFFYGRTRMYPEKAKARLLDMVRQELGPELVDKHFTPRYNPWDERLCLIPNADLFQTIKDGSVDVVTAEIDHFTENGIQLKNGELLEADIIVTATGLKLVVMGEAAFSVDGQAVDFADTWTYKGMMFSDVPNLVQTFGYINASWTLRADLTSEYVCRVLNLMDSLGMRQCTPRLRSEDGDMAARPWIVDFTPGYMQRAMHLFPKQGDRYPWVNIQNYAADKKMIRKDSIKDDVLIFSNSAKDGHGKKQAGHTQDSEAVAAS